MSVPYFLKRRNYFFLANSSSRYFAIASASCGFDPGFGIGGNAGLTLIGFLMNATN